MTEGWWDTFFDEDYLATYTSTRRSDEESELEAVAVARLLSLEPGASVLDAPCGYGRGTVPLAQRGYRMTGIDLSEVQLDEARRRAAGVVGVELVQGDLRALPFADGSFDGV